uniref:Genome polyprotein n=1 Tax=Riboviria sp. TaxID=2585031 RepID=A0A6M3YPH4_9VIRU|nr:MAG: hypothetical protein [Riboviria sp.]
MVRYQKACSPAQDTYNYEQTIDVAPTPPATCGHNQRKNDLISEQEMCRRIYNDLKRDDEPFLEEETEHKTQPQQNFPRFTPAGNPGLFVARNVPKFWYVPPGKNLYCSTCNKLCSSMATYDQHMVSPAHRLDTANRLHDGNNYCEDQDSWKCTVCSVSCDSLETLQIHYRGIRHQRGVRTLQELAQPDAKQVLVAWDKVNYTQGLNAGLLKPCKKCGLVNVDLIRHECREIVEEQSDFVTTAVVEPSTETSSVESGVMLTTIVPEAENVDVYALGSNETDGLDVETIDLTQNMAKPLLYYTYQWTPALNAGASVVDWQMPGDCYGLRKLNLHYNTNQMFELMRSDVQIDVHVTGQPFLAGKLVAYFLPVMQEDLHLPAQAMMNVQGVTGISACDSKVYRMTFPYSNLVYDYISTTHTPDLDFDPRKLCSFHLRCQNPIRSGGLDAPDKVGISIFVSYPNCSLKQPGARRELDFPVWKPVVNPQIKPPTAIPKPVSLPVDPKDINTGYNYIHVTGTWPPEVEGFAIYSGTDGKGQIIYNQYREISKITPPKEVPHYGQVDVNYHYISEPPQAPGYNLYPMYSVSDKTKFWEYVKIPVRREFVVEQGMDVDGVFKPVEGLFGGVLRVVSGAGMILKSVAGWFGLDKPSEGGRNRCVRLATSTEWPHSTEISDCVRLSTLPCTFTTPPVSSLNRDQAMDLYDLIRTPGWCYAVTWEMSGKLEDRLFQKAVTPHVWDPTTFKPGDEMYMTYLTQVALAFSFFSGPIDLTVEVIASKMHRGTLVGFHAPSDTPWKTVVEFGELSNFHVGTMSLEECHTFTFRLKQINNLPYVALCDVEGQQTQMNHHSNGIFYLNIMNNLTGPNNVSQALDVNIYLAAGDGFRFAVPAMPLLTIEDIPPDPTGNGFIGKPRREFVVEQSFFSSHTVTKSKCAYTAADDSHVGEDHMSMMCLVKRACMKTYTEHQLVYNGIYGKSFRVYIDDIFLKGKMSLTRQVGFNSWSCFFSQIFAYHRGSMRAHLRVRDALRPDKHLAHSVNWNPPGVDSSLIPMSGGMGTVFSDNAITLSTDIEVPWMKRENFERMSSKATERRLRFNMPQVQITLHDRPELDSDGVGHVLVDSWLEPGDDVMWLLPFNSPRLLVPADGAIRSCIRNAATVKLCNVAPLNELNVQPSSERELVEEQSDFSEVDSYIGEWMTDNSADPDEPDFSAGELLNLFGRFAHDHDMNEVYYDRLVHYKTGFGQVGDQAEPTLASVAELNKIWRLAAVWANHALDLVLCMQPVPHLQQFQQYTNSIMSVADQVRVNFGTYGRTMPRNMPEIRLVANMRAIRSVILSHNQMLEAWPRYRMPAVGATPHHPYPPFFEPPQQMETGFVHTTYPGNTDGTEEPAHEDFTYQDGEFLIDLDTVPRRARRRDYIDTSFDTFVAPVFREMVEEQTGESAIPMGAPSTSGRIPTSGHAYEQGGVMGKGAVMLGNFVESVVEMPAEVTKLIGEVKLMKPSMWQDFEQTMSKVRDIAETAEKHLVPQIALEMTNVGMHMTNIVMSKSVREFIVNFIHAVVGTLPGKLLSSLLYSHMNDLIGWFSPSATEVEEQAGDVVHPTIVKVVGLLITVVTTVMLGKKMQGRGGLETIYGLLAGTTLAGRFFTSIRSIKGCFDWICEMVSHIYHKLPWIVCPDNGPTGTKEFAQRAFSWVKQCEDFFNHVIGIETCWTADVRNRLYLLKDEGDVLMGEIFNAKYTNPSISVPVQHIMRTLNETIKECNPIMESSLARYDPFCVCFFGAAGIGKSAAGLKFCSDMGHLQGLAKFNLVYSRNDGDKYWSGYNGQPMVFVDDIGSHTDSEVVKEFLFMKSNSPFPLNMADLSDKGRHFTSKLVVTTCNNSFPELKELTHREAFYRRRNLLFRVDNIGRMPKDPKEFTNLQFSLIDSVDSKNSARVISGPYTYAEMLAFSTMVMRDYDMSQGDLISGIANPTEAASTMRERALESLTNLPIPDSIPNFEEILKGADVVEQALSNAQNQYYHLLSKVVGMPCQPEVRFVTHPFHREVVRRYVHQNRAAEFDMPAHTEIADLQEKVSDELSVLWDYAKPDCKKDEEALVPAIAMRVGAVNFNALESYRKFIVHMGQYSAQERREAQPEKRYYEKFVLPPDFLDSDYTPESRFTTGNWQRAFEWHDINRQVLDLDWKEYMELEYKKMDPKYAIRKKTKSTIAVEYAAAAMRKMVSMVESALKLLASYFEKFTTFLYSNMIKLTVVGCLMPMFVNLWLLQQAVRSEEGRERVKGEFRRNVVNSMHGRKCADDNPYFIYGPGDPDYDLWEKKKGKREQARVLEEQNGYHTGDGKHGATANRGIIVQSQDSDPQAENLITNRIIPGLYKGTICNELGNRSTRTTFFALEGKKFLINAHAIAQFPKDEQLYVILKVKGCDYYMPLNKEDYIINEHERDICVIRLGPRMVSFPNNIKHFVSLKDVEKLDRKGASLISKDDEGRCLMHLTEFTAVDYVDSATRRYRQVVQYDTTTHSGDCGSILVLHDTRIPHKIVGIHTARGLTSSQAYATVVDQETLREMCSILDARFEVPDVIAAPVPEHLVLLQSDPTFIPVGNFTILGKVKPEYQISRVNKTDFRPSPIHGQLYDVRSRPPLRYKELERLGLPQEPIVTSISKYGVPIGAFNDSSVKTATDFVTDLCRIHFKPQREPQLWSWKECVVGNPEFANMDRLNLNSSPGYPFVLKKGRKPGKREWISDEGEISADVLELCENYERRARKGKRTESIWMDCAKDERLPTEKVEAGKQRAFCAANMVNTIIGRRYFGDFAAAMYHNATDTFSLPGIDIHGPQWTKIWMKMRQTGSRGCSIDYKNWDGTLLPEVIQAVLLVIQRWYNDGEENFRVRACYFDELCHTTQIFRDCLYMSHQGSPSGILVCTIINTLGDKIFFCIAWIEINMQYKTGKADLVNMTSNVCDFIYGDDLTFTVSPAAEEYFNFTTIKAFFAQFGITVQLASKDGREDRLMPIEDLTLLKCGWRKDTACPIIIHPCLATDVIQELTNWIRKSPDEKQLFVDNLDDSLSFAYHYGEKYFNNHREGIMRVAGRMLDKPLLNYTELQRSHYEKYNISMGADLKLSHVRRNADLQRQGLQNHGTTDLDRNGMDQQPETRVINRGINLSQNWNENLLLV